MAISSPSSASFYCEHQHHSLSHNHDEHHHHLNHNDIFSEDEEQISLFTKEQLQTLYSSTFTFDHPSILLARNEAVEFILKVKSHFGFTHLTAIVAITYIDRFLSSFHFQDDNNKPWIMQLLAVTCLSLAAKLEETQVPSLINLQVCL